MPVQLQWPAWGLIIVLCGCQPGAIPGLGGNLDPGNEVVAPVRYVHPVFNTQVTASPIYPAIKVNILDATEGLGTAELYLSVQSSRFPAETRVLLPLNIGDFQGCTSRFVDLPFEVQPKDVLIFNLLDEDNLSDAEEAVLMEGCNAGCFLVWTSTRLYSPSALMFDAYAALSGSSESYDHQFEQFLGDALKLTLSSEAFDGFGNCQFIVPETMPERPNHANQLTILDEDNYGRAELLIYKRQWTGSLPALTSTASANTP